ncbi:hypothetical protein GCM10020254_02230 [Streptomyces goshikiensis]
MRKPAPGRAISRSAEASRSSPWVMASGTPQSVGTGPGRSAHRAKSNPGTSAPWGPNTSATMPTASMPAPAGTYAATDAKGGAAAGIGAAVAAGSRSGIGADIAAVWHGAARILRSGADVPLVKCRSPHQN